MLYTPCNRKWCSTSIIADFVLLSAGWQVKRVIIETSIDNNSHTKQHSCEKGLFVLALIKS